MSKEIIKDKKAEGVPATVTDVKAFQEANNLLYLAQQFGLAKLLAECAAIYNYRKSGAFSEDKSGSDFLQTIGMSLRSAQVRLKIANVMRTKVNRLIGLTKEAEFFFTEQTIKQTFGQYFEKRRDVGITDLLHASRDVQTFQNFLEGHTDIKESEVVKLLGNGSMKDAPPAAPAQGNLFSELESKLRKKGYKLREDGAWFNEETGKEMSRAELGALIDNEHALYLFVNAEKTLAELFEKVRSQRNAYAEYTLAYMEVHGDEPETKRLLIDEQNKLAKLGKDISFFVTTILHED